MKLEIGGTTAKTSVKGRKPPARPAGSMIVDDETLPYAFVLIDGTVELSEDWADRLCWAGTWERIELSRSAGAMPPQTSFWFG